VNLAERKSQNIAVLGGGAWGTALAEMAARLGHKVRLYARDEDVVAEINQHHTNSRYLPASRINNEIRAYVEAQAAFEDAEAILCVIPTQALGSVLATMQSFIPSDVPLVLCAKGIERSSGRLVVDIARAILPKQPLAVLSGPSFALDVVRGLPTAVTIAAKQPSLAQDLAQVFSGPSFRCYASDDLIGVQLGGALKNVLALAAGAASGRGLGLSAQAALVTRGFAELRRIGHAFSAKIETMNGLAVLGDLILTCSSPQSRNYSYGLALGQGLPTANLPLAEGVATAREAAQMCNKYGIEAPIIQAVAALVEGQLDIDVAVENLLKRPLKIED